MSAAGVMTDDARARALATSAAAQAVDASAELLRFVREGAHGYTPFDGEPIEQLADALKMSIEAATDTGEAPDEGRLLLHRALVAYLEGWVG